MVKKIKIGSYLIEITHNVVNDTLNIDVFDELGGLIESLQIFDSDDDNYENNETNPINFN